jgi:hypothetical protein
MENWKEIAPESKANKASVNNYKSGSEIIASETAHKSCRSEDIIKLEGKLLQAVCNLGQDQSQKNVFASSVHKAPLCRITP